MIEGLKPYAEYKNSDVDWIGRIPSSWRVRRAKLLFREIDDRSKTGREEMLSVSHTTGVTPRSQKKVTMFKAESNVGYKICRPDDLVINTLWAWMGALGVSRYLGLVSPAYGVYRPTAREDLLPSFADQLLRAPIYAGEYRRCSTGVRNSRLRLYPEVFLRIPVLLPPLNEQAAIVAFLDYANRKIDNYIRAKTRELSLVTEMLLTTSEQSLRASDGQVLRLSTIADLVLRPVKRRADNTYVRIGLFNRGRGIFHKRPVDGSELGDSDFFWVKEGDLIISGQFAWEGAVAFARDRDSGCVASHRYPILRAHGDHISSSVLLAVLRTTFGQMLLDHHSRGAAGRNRPLNIRTLLKEKIRIPPVSAQTEITRFLDREFAVSQSVARVVRLAQEYRSRVTADIVTGKLDVRAAAHELPVEHGAIDTTNAPVEPEQDVEQLVESADTA